MLFRHSEVSCLACPTNGNCADTWLKPASRGEKRFRCQAFRPLLLRLGNFLAFCHAPASGIPFQPQMPPLRRYNISPLNERLSPNTQHVEDSFSYNMSLTVSPWL